MTKIGFIGMGKLGLPCALAVESKGYEVKGYDIDPMISHYLNTGEIPYKEEGADVLLKKTKIVMTSSVKDLLAWADIVFVAVQTPHDPEYEGITRLPEKRVDFNYSFLIQTADTINTAVKELKAEGVKKIHRITIISTVLPGTMDMHILPRITDCDISIAYNPFFIAMGTTIQDFLNPEFILLGGEKENLIYMEAFYTFITTAPCYKCSIRDAEAIKVLYNTYITQKICFANAVMELCTYTGANADHVIDALSLGHRRIISPMYMRPGMGDGGGCHPRDNIALSFVAKKFGVSYDWWEGLMIAREKQTEFLVDQIIYYNSLAKKAFKNNGIIILGKTFKAETNLTTGSPAILLYNILSEKMSGDNVLHYDPYVDGFDQLENDFREGTEYLILECKLKFLAGVYFIATKHELFKEIVFPKDCFVLDPWGYIPNSKDYVVVHIGRNN